MYKWLPHLPSQLETERLVLRPFRLGDAPSYYAMCLGNKAHLLPFEAGNPILAVESAKDAEAVVLRFVVQWQERTAFYLGAWEKDSGAFAAQIYIGVVDRDLPEYEIGYFVEAAHEGQGYVTESVRAVLDFAFGPLGAHRVSLRCNDTNVRSYRVAERCGFRREGHLRENNERIRLDDGTPTGELIYGLLRREYLEVRSATNGS